MAKMHSRKLGRAGSTKPAKLTPTGWTRYKPKEVELLISKLAKEEKTPSQIGIIMRDVYGIPDVPVITKKSITKILEEKNLLPKIPEDLMALIKKSIDIRKHMEENKTDQTAKRGLLLTESKIKRLVKYYKSTKKLPLDWKYDAKNIKLLVD